MSDHGLPGTHWLAMEMKVIFEDYNLTLSRAARIAEISTPRIDQLARAGRLRFVLTPLGRLFSEADIRAYAAERRARQRPTIEA
jgi:hypothetical protein